MEIEMLKPVVLARKHKSGKAPILMLDCMISQKLCPAFFLEYLAKSTTWNGFIYIAYILFLTEMQKRQTLEKEFTLFKNDITTNWNVAKTQDT